MPPSLNPDNALRKQSNEKVKAAERQLDSESVRQLSDQLANGSAVSVHGGKTVRAAEPTGSAAAPSERSEGIGSDKKPLDITSAERTLEHNSGDLQGPGRKTTETRLTEKTHLGSESQKSLPQSNQSHFPPRYLVKETLKELEHDL